jgi:hypothetical protein
MITSRARLFKPPAAMHHLLEVFIRDEIRPVEPSGRGRVLGLIWAAAMVFVSFMSTLL